ncbi:MAG TPA: hypothetical protein VNL13_00875 [Sulfolobales archaeon]|nr:hypothetical protein [Sulfolobales archaeon]
MGYPPSDEGRDRDSRGEVEVKRSMMWEFPTAMNQSNAMKGSCGLGLH